MDLNYILEWTVGAMCAANLINILKVPGYWRTGWNIKLITIFAVVIIGLFLFPVQAGIVTGLLFLIFYSVRLCQKQL